MVHAAAEAMTMEDPFLLLNFFILSQGISGRDTPLTLDSRYLRKGTAMNSASLLLGRHWPTKSSCREKSFRCLRLCFGYRRNVEPIVVI